MHTYSRHLGDYAKDTRHLSMLEHGAYTLLIDWCYASEKALPSDEAMLYRICGAFSKPEQAAVQSVIQQFFQETPDGWLQKRIETELMKAHEKSGKAKQAALSRWSADAMRTHSERIADGLPTESGGNASRARTPLSSSSSLSNPPAPRQRGKSGKLIDPVFSEDLEEGYRAPLTAWFRYKQEKRQAYTSTGWAALVQQQAAFPPEAVAASVQASLAANWQGLFTDKVINSVASRPGFGAEKKEGGAAGKPIEQPEPTWDWRALHEEIWMTAPSCRWHELPKSTRFELRQAYAEKKERGAAGDE